MKKKFLLYVAVIVTCLFLGFTIYYIARNDENMYLNIDNSKAVYINVDEIIEWPVVWTKPYKDTTLTVLVGNENVLSYDKQTKVFTGKTGGYTNVTITSSNKHFGPFVFEVYVGDGSLSSPYLIKDAASLAKIGNDQAYTASKNYALANDIDLKGHNNGKWASLPEFSGSFNGNGYTIYNLNLENASNAGLFSSISSTGSVENVKFERVQIEGEYSNVGAVAGINKGIVGKVSVKGSIVNTKEASSTGSVVGQNIFENTPAYINMCSAEVQVSGATNVGGIAGSNYSSVIINSSSVVSFTTQFGQNVGGIVGLNQSSFDSTDNLYYPSAIVKCYAVVNEVNATTNFVGAVVGNNAEEDNGNVLNRNIYENVIYALGDGITANSVGGGADLGA
ncbi:MAG: hypothetical protein IJW25_02810, partial [Clostridia bacterium]|nr:hypothetical protein [Clostridia bacterium]